MNEKAKISNSKLLLSGSGIIAIIGLSIYVSLVYGNDILPYLKNPELLRKYLLNLPVPVHLSLFLLQILQVIISPIPGEVVQTAGGFLLGKYWGLLFNILGIAIGSAASFYLGRFLGQPFLIRFISEEKISKFSRQINSEKGFWGLLILFLIPGAPKDILSYISGITPLKFWHFIIISTIGRFPGIFVTTYLGSQFAIGNYRGLIIVIVLLIIGFIFYLIFKKRIVNHFLGD
ncbi:MAG: TVP38/TMEM64 family protein [Candidatus Coatesbacteria bacterium]|nr:TVP38/TMEM64 family protein [Candidatus Coatesbacteria bacterium]